MRQRPPKPVIKDVCYLNDISAKGLGDNGMSRLSLTKVIYGSEELFTGNGCQIVSLIFDESISAYISRIGQIIEANSAPSLSILIGR